MNSLTQSQRRTILPIFIALALICFALLPTAQALLPPPTPDGGYPNANTAEGDGALFNVTTGSSNTVIGYNALYSNTSGYYNTASGESALSLNTTGYLNTASGFRALVSNTTGYNNTANGAGALYYNGTGIDNTANGSSALGKNRTGDNNTASGSGALYSNTTGNDNSACGFQALQHNSSSNNTATGSQALFTNVGGTQNTANGVGALYSNASGSYNTANGLSALHSNLSGSSNTADGINALFSNTTGNSNVALGDRAGSNLTTGSNNIIVGAGLLGTAGDANTIRVGKSGTQKKTFIAGIRGVTVASGVGVIVGTTGQLGTVVSSARFKEAIEPMDKASEAILALKPISFRYKHELDPDGIRQFGLIAEEVEKVNPDLVVRDEDGNVNTVRYEAVNAMLLNEFLKEHRTVQEQQKEIDTLRAELKEQSAFIQRVNDKIGVNKPAPQNGRE